MDVDVRKIIEEKDKKIEELQAKIKDLERKLRYYEIKEIYHGLVPDDFLQKLMDLPPEIMVIEIGKYFREKSAEKSRREIEKTSTGNEEIKKALEELKVIETKLGGVRAKVGADLNFTQRFDFSGSEVAFLGEDLMKSLGVSEGDYIVVQRDGSVTLRTLPYSKPGLVIVPTWVREKIGAKVNDMVEVVKR
ncbi:MAG: hypothetical protein NZ879_00670 [Archaeoglobaceae archaeon]|nr:hypothetical protein [Archaeoglobaceae archaeon]MDW8117480.1 hypothetical protein [Archaeoglobaceae archaeon]